MYDLIFGSIAVISGVAAIALLRLSFRAQRRGVVIFWLGAGLGLISAVALVGTAPVTSLPLVFLAVVVYVTAIVQWLAITRATWLRAMFTALQANAPLEHVLQASLQNVNPFDRHRIQRGLDALQSGVPPHEIASHLPMTAGLRLAAVRQLHGSDTSVTQEMIDLFGREQQLLESRAHRGGHWLYVALPAFAFSIVGTFYMWLIRPALSDIADIPQPTGNSWPLTLYFSDSFTLMITVLLPCAMTLAFAAAVLGTLQFSGIAPFAPWGASKKVWAIRVLPIFAAAVRQRIPIAECADHIGARHLPRGATKLLHVIQHADANGQSWVEALRHKRYITRADAELLDAATAANDLPWAIGTVSDRLLSRWSDRHEFANAVIFPSILMVIAIAIAQIPISLFVWMSHVITDV